MLKKSLLALVCLLMAAVPAGAQEPTEATAYFDNKPFGWATCSDLQGTPYQLTGGYYAKRPKTTVLYASGGDDRQALNHAIQNFDVVILDGSKGHFTISKTLDLKDVKNKSILGRNGARLCTQWYLTDELRQALIDADITKYSSTGGGGTLPNGQKIDEDRAYYTRLTLIEATGDVSESYRGSGIFKIRGAAENIIVRNLVLQGPGSVDVDGDDLVSNNGGNHVWIDHCEFIDAMDGSLDSGHNPTEMFVTYSWNVFRYTSRSFSHSYSNGTGWYQGFMQYITYADCIWGAGCNRRLPQADHVYIHMLNNYYNCPGNAVAIAVGAMSEALIEGNYAVSGVKGAFSPGSSSDLYYVCRDNVGFGSYNDKSNTTRTIAPPYTYYNMSGADVPAVLTSAGGAGATLDDPTPDVGQDTSPSAQTEAQTWDFGAWSEATVERLKADTEQWKENGTNYECLFSQTYQEPLTAGGEELSETRGLLFTVPAAGNLVIYTAGSGPSLRLNKTTNEVVIPQCRKGDEIELLLRTANGNEERGVTVSNATPDKCLGKGSSSAPYSATFAVQADGDVVLRPTGGIYLHAISLTRAVAGEKKTGDVDGSGLVDVSDVTAIISHILGKTPEGFDAAVADADGNGLVNVTDVTHVIAIILGQ